MTAIEFQQVSVAFAKRKALTAVSARIRAGVVTGIVGPNGAGKTTMLRAALGLQPVTQGTIHVLGRPLGDWQRDALSRAVAYLPQGGEARWPMLAGDVVLLGRLPHRHAIGAPALRDRLAAADALERCDAWAFAYRRMDELSAGERARVLLARALATGAEVLIGDEPAAYLDPAHQLGLMELMRDEARRGAAVIVTLHDLSLAARFCDDVLVLHEGRLAAGGPPGQALSSRTLAEVFRLTPAADSTGLGAFSRL